MAYEIKLLDLCDIELDASFLVLGRGMGTQASAKTWGCLLLGGDDPILVDTGAMNAEILGRLGMTATISEEMTLESQLGLHGVAIDDVRWVLHTHHHIDHAGQDARFERATVVTTRRELEFSASGIMGAQYPPEYVKHHIDRLHSPGALRLLDLDDSGPIEVLPGIVCESARGHTEGSMNVLVETAEGTACICGDVIYDIQDQVVDPWHEIVAMEPRTTGNHAMTKRQEKGAIKKALNSGTFVLPIHDYPARVEGGRVVARLGRSVPGPEEPVGAVAVADVHPCPDCVTVTYLEAITAALRDALREDERVFLLGEDIGHFGGAFGVTKALWEEFGERRILDTPIAEEGFVGAAIGAAWMGDRPVVELQFGDFATCPFDMIVTVAAKTHWRSGIPLPLVIRAPSGGGVRGGPFHSSCPEGWFAGVPGLKVVCPGTVADAYGLLRAAIEDDDPVLFFEHKALYRRLHGPAPEPGHRVPLGRAAIVQEGPSATVVTYGSGVELAVGASDGLDVEVLDLRTVWPLDEAAVLESAARTSRVLVLQEASGASGVAGLVLGLVARAGFEHLDAPPVLVAPPNTPVPFAPELEDAYLPSAERVRAELEELLAY